MPSLTIMVKPVSSSCNMRCRYCFYSDVASRRELASMGRMDEKTLDNLVRRALRYADGHVSFAFQGGEPTLAGLDFFKRLVELEHMYNARGVSISNAVQTNGYALSDEMIDFFVKEHFLIGVSFDGVPEIHDALRLDAAGHGTSGRVQDTLRRLEEKHAEFNVLCVVNRYVAEKPDEVFAALSKYGYIQYIACLDDFDGSRRDYSLTPELYGEFLRRSFDMYYREYKAGRFVSVRNFDNYIGILAGRRPENCGMCGQCSVYYLVEADGGVYPCDFYVLDKWRLGSVNDSSFFALSKSPLSKQFVDASLYVSEKCRGCKWYSLCRGGCRRDREPFVDGHPGLNQWCSSFTALFEYAYPRMCEMASELMDGRGGA